MAIRRRPSISLPQSFLPHVSPSKPAAGSYMVNGVFTAVTPLASQKTKFYSSAFSVFTSLSPVYFFTLPPVPVASPRRLHTSAKSLRCIFTSVFYRPWALDDDLPF